MNIRNKFPITLRNQVDSCDPSGDLRTKLTLTLLVADQHGLLPESTK